MIRKLRGDKDPLKPPPPEKGDLFILFGLGIGIIAGVYIARAVNNFLAIIGSAAVGLAIGIALSAYIRRRRRKKLQQLRGEIQDNSL